MFLHRGRITLGIHNLLAVLRALGDAVAVEITDKGTSPEFGPAFHSDPVDRRIVAAVCDGVGDLRVDPRAALKGGQRFRQRYAGLSMAELLKAVWNIDLSICPECGCASMQQLGRSYAPFP